LDIRILDGKKIALAIREEIRQEVQRQVGMSGKRPCLAVALVGDDPASQVYVRNKEKACELAGIVSVLKRLPESTTTSQLLGLLNEWNQDPSIHGILVQLPVPAGIDSRAVLDAIDPRKDVDAFAAENVGRISQDRPRFLPCTPHGVVQLLAREGIETEGKEVVVVGRSDIVGKPLAMMLLQKEGPCGSRFANATVTCCHSRSQNLASITRRADILIAAIGKPNFVGPEMVKPGAVVIDVGINRLGDKLVGDVDFDAVSRVASAITPVPGGIGPLTIAMLLHNTMKSFSLLEGTAART
jgi:methylenetetrahydrofolate dehydrogenase (NADP+)/methenyltetrahydrofolate cyclohydrolase